MDNILQFIGLMRKANALGLGQQGAEDSCRSGKAKLVVIACDASENTKKAAGRKADEASVPTVDADYSKQALGKALGIVTCSVFSIDDAGFAGSFLKKMSQSKNPI